MSRQHIATAVEEHEHRRFTFCALWVYLADLQGLNATPFYLDAEDIHFHAGLCASEHGVSHLWVFEALASNDWWQYGILPSRGGPPMHPSCMTISSSIHRNDFRYSEMPKVKNLER